MLKTVTLLACLLICSCATIAPTVNPAAKVDIYGVSALPPQQGHWLLMTHSGYQVVFGSNGANQKESLIANIGIYQLDAIITDRAWLEHVIKFRAAAPDIGRFEESENTESLVTFKQQACVKYRSISIDSKAKIGDGTTASMLLETAGLHCRHPLRPTVGVHIEYSLRHFAHNQYSTFDSDATRFFEQVNFTEF